MWFLEGNHVKFNISNYAIRLDRKNESDTVVPFLTKQTRLINFRFEFPKYIILSSFEESLPKIYRTNNLNETGMQNFARIFGKLVSLKYLEQVITE